MADINNVTIAGRLTRDGELKYTNTGTAIMRLSVAVNTRKKDGDQWVDEPNFFDVTLFGKLGESLGPYLTKGKPIAIEGSLRQDRWEQDGVQRNKVGIIASNIMLLGGNRESSSSAPSFEERKVVSHKPQKPAVSDSDFEDDIPF